MEAKKVRWKVIAVAKAFAAYAHFYKERLN
jgi:hypothetical protein